MAHLYAKFVNFTLKKQQMKIYKLVISNSRTLEACFLIIILAMWIQKLLARHKTAVLQIAGIIFIYFTFLYMTGTLRTGSSNF